MQKPESKSTFRKDRIIVVPFDQDQYSKIIFAPYKFRESLDNFFKLYPEIFLSEINLMIFAEISRDLLRRKKNYAALPEK